MRQGVVQALEYSDSRNELAWLVLRVIGRLAPCTETSLIASIAGDYTTSDSPTGHIILDALVKLKALGFIQSAEEQIGITDEGRRFLDELLVDPLSPRALHVAFLTALASTSLAKHTLRLKRFCQDCLAGARAVTQRNFPMSGGRARDTASQIWRRAPLIGFRETTLVLRRLVRMCRTRAEAWAIIVRNRHRQTRALLWKGPGVGGLILKTKLAGRSHSVIFGGALLVVALTTAGGFAFLSGKRGAPTVIDTADHSSSPAGAVEPNAPATLITRTEAVRIAIQDRLSRPNTASEPRKREQGALVEFYSAPDARLLWIGENGLTERGKAVMMEIAKADDYGLRASDYKLPNAEGLSADGAAGTKALADAEIKISLAVLRYAQDARGGRMKPARLTKNLDPTLALPDPLEVMDSIAVSGDPAVYLRSFQPSHPQFEALRQKLLEVRGQAATSIPSIIIPRGPVLKKGVEHEQVALLRKRLEVSSDDGNESLYDDLLDEAVRKFQTKHRVVPDGLVGAGTRRVLNQQAHAERNLAKQRLILLNMERWRWLPHDLGPFYINVNVPEFMARVVKDSKVIHTTRVVVGKPNKQTPVFSDEIETVVFGPFWNVPNSIKVEEIRPYVRANGGWLFSVHQRIHSSNSGEPLGKLSQILSHHRCAPYRRYSFSCW